MKKFIPAITLVTLLTLQAPVQAAWSAKNKSQSQEVAPNTPGFNLQDNRSWFLEADYLLWKPMMEDCFFSVKTSSPNIGSSNNNSVSAKGKLKQPGFDLSSGVRVGIGGYNSDSWDVGLRGTYLYSDAEKTVRANSSSQTIALPDWFGSIFGLNGIKANNKWSMNFGLVDLTFGREFFLTKRFAAHPFIGLRGAIINQTMHVRYSADYQLQQPNAGAAITVVGKTKFSAKNDMWGIGPRVGLDLNFYLSKDWSFLGGLAGSLLYTKYSVKEKFNGLSINSKVLPEVLNPVFLKMNDHSNFGRANLDAYFGLGWSHWYNSGKKRVSIALAFEAQQWFSLNQWFGLDLTNSGSSIQSGNVLNVRPDKRHGDLSLIGGTLHFQLDF
jgi:hypothetical protein